MELFFQSILNSVVQSSFYILWAIGLVLIFGVMGVVNFAHGELVMIGAYSVWFLHSQLALSFYFSIILAVALVIAIGLSMEYFLFRPKRGDPLGGLICSVGVLFILQVVAAFVGGTGPSKQVAPPFPGVTSLFDASLLISNQKIFSLVVIFLTLLALLFFLKRTKLGWSLRAVALDTEAATLQGININRTSFIAMAIGAGLAGLAGALIAPISNINPYMGHNVIITAFIITIVGGLGNLLGAVIAAILYAFFHTFMTTYIGDTIATISGLLIMTLVLIISPTGILGKEINE